MHGRSSIDRQFICYGVFFLFQPTVDVVTPPLTLHIWPTATVNETPTTFIYDSDCVELAGFRIAGKLKLLNFRHQFLKVSLSPLFLFFQLTNMALNLDFV